MTGFQHASPPELPDCRHSEMAMSPPSLDGVEQPRPTAVTSASAEHGTARDAEPRPVARATAPLPRMVVHELRTPLTAIHGYAQLLQRGMTNEVLARKAVETILRESGRLSVLLAQLSEVAELDSDAFPINRVEVDLVPLARGAAQRAAQGHPDRAMVVESDRAVLAYTDARRVSQVLSHLVGNAVDYTQAGGHITIRLARHRDGAEITVSDSGIGIVQEDADRVYEPFQRGRNAELMGVRGLGLGLYVVREVVSRMGGRVWHEPNVAGGTAFHVHLVAA